MNLRNKKKLISRTLGVGLGRISLDSNRLEEIKEAITRQDMRDLKKEGVIKVKEKKGKRKIKKRKTKRREGKIRKRNRNRKREYVKLVRKLRTYLKVARAKGKVSKEEYYDFRKKIRARRYKDLAHLKGAIRSLKE